MSMTAGINSNARRSASVVDTELSATDRIFAVDPVG